MNNSRPHVVIIGSGFGGLFAAKRLAGADVDITLVAKTTHHLFQPLLYQVATGILSPGEIAPATREILKEQENVRVLLSEVTGMDLEARTIRAEALGTTTELSYDHLIVAAGAGQSYFGNDHFAVYAPGMKSIDDALELRARIFGALEVAELTEDEQERERLLTFVVVGAGPTGVEMAGQIRELTSQTVKGEYRRIDPSKARVLLLDAADRVLPPFGERLSGKAKEKLEAIGVEVKLGAMVTGVDENGLDLKYSDERTERIEGGCKVWAAGVQASPLGRMIAEQSEAEVDRAGRLQVNKDCTVPGHPEVYVVGDMMSLDKLPGVAQVAIQTGQYAADRIIGDVTGKPVTRPFRYHDKGSMAVISKFGAVMKAGKVELTGFPAWVAWLALHLLYIVGFKAQFTTLVHWAIAFVGGARSERITTRQQMVARLAVQQLGEDFRPTVTGTQQPKKVEDKAEPTIG
ncbi:NADH dehydrogenase FAD-containing subunit [Luteococcus japonicus]|uniref:NADH:ubiquinone reductase (non-electrogenic) n=2 Tax=Luteococcus japonicus TaxID=33984 RepID=A0A1R4KA44_9ACTN|nr:MULTISPECIES: NAD(P)/FAD-dependent oxidoreductase [Luteococcus]MDN5563991.1 NAD(P)/FAD-dependent oxidoreductase [Luteococcus sp.]ROR54476.1 NADH dehydrogenase FAD-containing subunit [Luteococcus japonicus]SJN41167.1 NADH dehydrogenase [Luteococcus japonicus LSP_Lj1]